MHVEIPRRCHSPRRISTRIMHDDSAERTAFLNGNPYWEHVQKLLAEEFATLKLPPRQGHRFQVYLRIPAEQKNHLHARQVIELQNGVPLEVRQTGLNLVSTELAEGSAITSLVLNFCVVRQAPGLAKPHRTSMLSGRITTPHRPASA